MWKSPKLFKKAKMALKSIIWLGSNSVARSFLVLVKIAKNVQKKPKFYLKREVKECYHFSGHLSNKQNIQRPAQCECPGATAQRPRSSPPASCRLWRGNARPMHLVSSWCWPALNPRWPIIKKKNLRGQI